MCAFASSVARATRTLWSSVANQASSRAIRANPLLEPTCQQQAYPYQALIPQGLNLDLTGSMLHSTRRPLEVQLYLCEDQSQFYLSDFKTCI